MEPCSWNQAAAIRLLQFAYAAYCDASALQAWSCNHCAVESGFQVQAVMSDASWNTYGFVGYSTAKNEIIVSYRGTEETSITNWIEDLKFFKSWEPFDGLSGCYVASGFNGAYASLQSQTQAAVQALTAQYPTASLTVTGHSLGGAIAEIDSLFFALNIPGVSIKTVTYGTPRVGNLDFAQLIDSHVPNFSRVNNMLDVIPIVPGRFLGFSHPDGEIHILSTSGNAVACSGNDDATDPNCTDKSVPNIFEGNILDHLGPYDGIFIGTIYCT